MLLGNTVRGAPLLLAGFAVLCGCGRTSTHRPEITVAAAANLTDVFGEIAREFEARSGVHVVYSFASTGDLTRQIENAAPFDVFAAADVRHVDELAARGLIAPGSRAIYGRGRLALWTPPGGQVPVKRLEDLAEPSVRFIAIAKPETAPYGAAAVEALKKSGLWSAVEKKIVYAESISMAKQYASTHNADAALTAYSLVLHDAGHAVPVDEWLHAPIEQAICVLKTSTKQELALRYEKFVLGEEGRKILSRFGYLITL